TLEDAWPVTLPAVFEVKVIVHWPDAFVFAPAVVQLPVGAEWAAPLESASVTSTCSPAAATNVPVPVSFSSVTVTVWGAPTPSGALTYPLPSPAFTFTCAVNVCGWPTRLTPFGVIWMFASTNVLTASPELPAVASVCTVKAAEPLTDSVDDAWPSTLPAVAEV